MGSSGVLESSLRFIYPFICQNIVDWILYGKNIFRYYVFLQKLGKQIQSACLLREEIK